MDYVITNSDGRVCAWTFDEKYAVGFEKVDLPDGFEVAHMTDWTFVDGEWAYDPLPEPAPEVDRLEAIEAQLDALAGVTA